MAFEWLRRFILYDRPPVSGWPTSTNLAPRTPVPTRVSAIPSMRALSTSLATAFERVGTSHLFLPHRLILALRIMLVRQPGLAPKTGCCRMVVRRGLHTPPLLRTAAALDPSTWRNQCCFTRSPRCSAGVSLRSTAARKLQDWGSARVHRDS